MAHLVSDLAVESAANHISLLFRSKTDEIDGIAKNSNGELRVLVRILHSILERIFIDHVQVHVEPPSIEVEVERLDSFIDQLAFRQMRLLWSDGDRIADAVL